MIEIRRYQPSDCNDIAALMDELGYPVSLEDMKQRMHNIEASSSYHTFIALIDGIVAGMVGIRLVWNYESNYAATQISTIVTKSIYRGQGVGTRFIQFVEQWAIEHNSEMVFLTSGSKPDRLAAHGLYEKCGCLNSGVRFVTSLIQGE
jgi:GNAT superfamily N-acetyltransferase